MKRTPSTIHIKKNYIHNLFTLLVLSLAVITLLSVLISVIKIITTSAPDFPSFYWAAVDLLHHKNPYIDKNIPNVFIYPAAASLFYLPFTLLPFAFAQGTFVIMSALAVPFIVYLSLKIIYKRFSWRLFLLFASLAFLSFPTKFTLGMGQVNLLALLIVLGGYYFYQKDRFVISGIFMGLAFLLKPILSFIILFFLIQRAWKTIRAIIMTLLVLFIISFTLYGFLMDFYYIKFIVPQLINGTSGREVYYNQGILGFVSRLTDDVLLRKYIPTILSISLVSYSFYILWKRKLTMNLQFSLFLTLLPIVHTLSWQHYFVVLIFPFILITKIILEEQKYLIFIPLIVSYLLVSWNIKNPSLFFHFPMSLLLSHTIYGALILLVLLFRFALHKNKYASKPDIHSF